MFAHAHDTELNHTVNPCMYKNGEISIRLYTIIRLSLDDSGVLQQMIFISGSSLPQLSDHIFEIVQDLVVAEIKW